MKPVHEMSSAELLAESDQREVNRIAAGLERAGVPRDKALAQARREVAGAAVPRPQRFGAPTTPIVAHPGFFVAPEAPIVAPAPAIEWPLRLTLPWSLLVSDNERKEPYLVLEGGKQHARMRLTKRYREAAAKIEQLVKAKLGDATPAAVPLELTARVFVPGGRLDADVVNFAKGVHDALEYCAGELAARLHAVHWIRAGVDVDAPRAEVNITPEPRA